MTHIQSKSSFLDTLRKRTLVFDGAMGTNLQAMNLTPAQFGGERTAGCNDYLVISCPEAVASVHNLFLEAGVDVIETCTFRANRFTLRDYGLEDQTYRINFAAAQLARKLADKFSTSGQNRFVAGSIGPSGKLPSMNDPEMSNVTFDELKDVFREQAIGLIRGGVDLLLLETSQDILEVKIAILGIQQAFSETGISVPIQAQVTLDTTGRMLLGTDIAAVLAILEGFPIDVIGLNCSTGPDHMREPIRYLGEHSSLPVSCIPNAGLPLNIDGQAVYPLKPEAFANAMAEFVEKYHVRIVGGCCGTTPEHLRLLVQALSQVTPNVSKTTPLPSLASSVQATPLHQEPRPFLIGERLNSQGSKQFKNLLLAEDFESMLPLARQQVDNGAHALDLCVALTERTDEADLMRRLVKLLSPVVRTPFVFDTTEPEVMEIALQTAPGRSLLNSTNLEGGRTKADQIFALAKTYNAAVIALTIDEKGMAKTASRKLEIAQRIYNIAVGEYSLQPADLIFDPLTFTLATGDQEFSQSAIETLEGIRSIKSALPGVLTSLGISNVSFGLTPQARGVLNSAMLYHAVQAGLDMAIVNPAQVTPYADLSDVERNICDDLIFNRKPEALQILIDHFDKTGPGTRKKAETSLQNLKKMSAEQRIHWRILHRQKEEVESDIDEIILACPPIDRATRAVEVLNNVLLPAMKEVGDKFGNGELILPFVLQSAEVMKAAVLHVEKYLDKKEGISKGTLVLATVYGDVHDIGKNLVKTILSNNGYTVVDLGKQVPMETIIAQAIQNKADAIGLSALLVSTSRQMPLIINELQRRGLEIPVLIGGAAINRRFGRRILLTEAGRIYNAGVFYCKDALEGLATMDGLSNTEKRSLFIRQIREEAKIEWAAGEKTAAPEQPLRQRSSVPAATIIPTPPHWGPRLVRDMSLETIFKHLSLNELFRLSWGAKNTHGEEWQTLKIDFETRLETMRRQALQEKWLQPQGMYGYFPCQSDGNDLIIFDPKEIQDDHRVELTRMSFPRQPDGENLCLADYFSSLQSSKVDVVIFQVVTVGREASLRFERLQENNNYSEAYFTHGLSVQMAEATADYLHNHIRQELGIGTDQGKRYSWGYPAIPELADHAKVFKILPVERELGIKLTSAYQLVPEQSTAAIILHHPAARYYNVSESRINQLTR